MRGDSCKLLQFTVAPLQVICELLQLHLRPLALGDVLHHGDDPDNRAVLMPQRGVEPLAHDLPAVPGNILIHAVCRGVARYQALPDAVNMRLNISGHYQLIGVSADRLLKGVSENALGSGIPDLNAELRVPHDAPDGHSFNKKLKAVLALPDRFLGPLRLGDVPDRAYLDLPSLIGHLSALDPADKSPTVLFKAYRLVR